MNFGANKTHSVVLSSYRPGAPYEDSLEENGMVLIYEGHDEPRTKQSPFPKQMDQPLQTRSGKFTQNGLFHQSAQSYVRGGEPAARVRVYEKIKPGIWSYNGLFALIDSWTETGKGRRVFKFKLLSIPDEDSSPQTESQYEDVYRRIIPTHVKLAVWKRDRGLCAICESPENLHFDHILPYSRGGSSETAENIQLLCMRHNIQKGARIV